AVVELDEGVRMTANITGVDNSAITVGMPVEAVFEPVSDTVSLVKFRQVG
ncbi:MAG: OB-fold domain-containing protein, partial [Chloroflexi bacterium]|nr:OB-fold domain-containing protein [Chloroflexota bacterium]